MSDHLLAGEGDLLLAGEADLLGDGDLLLAGEGDLQRVNTRRNFTEISVLTCEVIWIFLWRVGEIFLGISTVYNESG